MAKAIPTPELSSNGTSHAELLHQLADNRAARHLQVPNGSAQGNHLDFWGSPEAQGESTRGLSGENPELMRTLGIDPSTAARSLGHPPSDVLTQENAELRAIIADLKETLTAADNKANEKMAEKIAESQKEMDAMLEEKSEIIRDLHGKIQELEARPVTPPTPKEEELIALSEELERERCQLQQERRQVDEDRKQLEEDEQIMTQQMREMEVQMARERADFARQRTELGRIQDEIRREMENFERNGLLNQRLGQLRQRLDVATSRPAGESPMPRNVPEAVPVQAEPAGTSSDGGEMNRRESFLGRLFG